jgi:hypothetical protein
MSAALVDHLASGRSAEARRPTDEELRSTLVIRLRIGEASVKVRTGGPIDDEDDLALPVWAGVVPMHLTAGSPERDDAGVPDVALPAYLTP